MRRRPYKAAVVGGAYGREAKAVSLQTFDDWLEAQISQGDGKSIEELYKAVAWIFYCLQLRANLVSGIPYLVYPVSVEKDEEDKDVEWGIDMRDIFWRVEAWLALTGAAYVLQVSKGRTLERLQVLNANTVKVKEWDDEGPISFVQRWKNRERIYPAERIIYVRTWSTETDIGPGTAGGHVSKKPGALIDAINQYAEAFFENGAIPAVLLTTEGSVPSVEKERIRSNWEKMLRGVQRAFKTEVLERGLTPTVIGQPTKDLAMPDLEVSKRNQILAAFGVPPGYVDRMNRAERALMEAALWNNCLIPECETWIEPAFNEQLYNPRGLRISFQYRQIEALQEQELQKAEASSFLITGVMKTAFDAGVATAEEFRSWVARIGEWSNMPPLDENWTPVEKEDRIPPQLQAANEEAAASGPGVPTPMDERIENRLPKAVDGHPKVTAPQWGHHRVSLKN